MPVTNNIEIGTLTRPLLAYSVSGGKISTIRGLFSGYFHDSDIFMTLTVDFLEK